jgi:hypothetical protein
MCTSSSHARTRLPQERTTTPHKACSLALTEKKKKKNEKQTAHGTNLSHPHQTDIQGAPETHRPRRKKSQHTDPSIRRHQNTALISRGPAPAAAAAAAVATMSSTPGSADAPRAAPRKAKATTKAARPRRTRQLVLDAPPAEFEILKRESAGSAPQSPLTAAEAARAALINGFDGIVVTRLTPGRVYLAEYPVSPDAGGRADAPGRVLHVLGADPDGVAHELCAVAGAWRPASDDAMASPPGASAEWAAHVELVYQPFVSLTTSPGRRQRKRGKCLFFSPQWR